MAQTQENYNTLKQTLDSSYRVDQLKSLAKQISKTNPTRKVELVEHITSLVFKNIDTIIADLDTMAINSLAEAVHNWDGCYKSKPFYAKYGTVPQVKTTRGEMHLLYLFFINGRIPMDLMAVLEKKINKPASEKLHSQCDGLMQIRINELGAYVLGISSEYGAMEPQDFEIHDTDIIYTGEGVPTPDHSLYLDKIAGQIEVGRWHLSLTSLLNALKQGETLKEIKDFINQISLKNPGEPLVKLFKHAEERSSAVVDKGKVTLLACNREIRKQILTDKKMSTLCLPAGEHHLVILPDKEEPFARYLEALGIIIGS